MKRRSDKVSIDSPIKAQLEIKKENSKLIAKVTFVNISDKDIIINKKLLGGDKLKAHIFHLNPWYTSPNLTFKPYKDNNDSPHYIIMKPNDTIVTLTDLYQYYNFNERKYDTLTITYLSIMDCLDEKYKQTTKLDIDGIVKPVNFHIRSNDVDLDYIGVIKK